MTDEAFEMLSTYLDDHRAGAAGGRSLVRRMANENSDTGWAEKLATLADEIEADVRTLDEVRRSLGVRGGLAKRGLARLAAEAGRLKLNRRLVGYSPLSRVLEAEAMMAGVTARKCLWSAMQGRGEVGDHTARFDFAALEKKAVEHIELLTEFHTESAKTAFTGAHGHGI